MKKLAILLIYIIIVSLVAGAHPNAGGKNKKTARDGISTMVVPQNIVTVDCRQTTDVDKRIFASVNEALKYAEKHWSEDETLEIVIAPGVYWVDDPDDNTVKRPKPGSATPFGLEVRMSNVKITGMGEKPEDVVLASQRGQTQGADGNFTMLHIAGNDIKVRNITFGNYCNVDLVYPKDPTLNRKRKADAIVQAQLVICNGDRYQVDDCRFISRLNLCPFAGARHVLFRNCYFECTDDALTGTGVYIGCKFTLFSGKPFYSTSRQGAVLVNCDVHCKTSGVQYMSKIPAAFFIMNCRFTSDDPQLRFEWTPEPGEELRCYESELTLNGKRMTIGDYPNTIDMRGTQLLEEFKRKLDALDRLEDPASELQYLPAPLYIDNPITTIEADVEETETRYLASRVSDGREVVHKLIIQPKLLPAPKVLKALTTKKVGNVVTADYKLDLQGHKDMSQLLWYRVRAKDSVLVQAGGTTYEMTGEDNGWQIACKLIPNSNRSMLKKVKHFSEYRQDRVLPGFWTFDTYKPLDTSEYQWDTDKYSSGWRWGRGVDGAADSYGYIQSSRGARMMYTPVAKTTGGMSVTVLCDPCKSAGQGFGSATGQYLDVCVKMNNNTLTGYALRLRRTPLLDKAVEAVLIKYVDGKTEEICSPAVTTLFKKGCHIVVNAEGEELTATISRDGVDEAPVSLAAKIEKSDEGGFVLQHTGSIGASALVVKEIAIDSKECKKVLK